jgi:hypothetical protein
LLICADDNLRANNLQELGNVYLLKQEYALAYDALMRGLTTAEQCDPTLAAAIAKDLNRCEQSLEAQESWCVLL